MFTMVDFDASTTTTKSFGIALKISIVLIAQFIARFCTRQRSYQFSKEREIMAPSKKTVKVGTITYEPANITLDVTVDRDTKHFKASYAGQYFEDADGTTLERKVLEAIEASLQIDWHPIIIVKPIYSNTHNKVPRDESMLGFDIDRKWIALFPDGMYKECQWNAQGDKEKYRLQWSHAFDWRVDKAGSFEPPCCIAYGQYGQATYYLPYTEELWQRFEQLQEKIKEIRTYIMSILDSPQVIQILLASSFPLMLSETVTKSG